MIGWNTSGWWYRTSHELIVKTHLFFHQVKTLAWGLLVILISKKPLELKALGVHQSPIMSIITMEFLLQTRFFFIYFFLYTKYKFKQKGLGSIETTICFWLTLMSHHLWDPLAVWYIDRHLYPLSYLGYLYTNKSYTRRLHRKPWHVHPSRASLTCWTHQLHGLAW